MSTQGTIDVLDHIDITSYFATGNAVDVPITIVNPNNGYSYSLSATYLVGSSSASWFSNKSLGSSTASLYNTTFRLTYINIEDFLDNTGTTTRVSATFTLTTKLGDSVVGTDSKTVDVYFATNSYTKPVITGMTFGEANTDVSGLESHHYLQNKSVIRATFAVTTITGSSVKTLRVVLNGRSYVASYSSGTMKVDFTPTDIGSFTPICYVTDSRNLTGIFTPSFSLLVTEYFAPKITSYTLGRINGVGTTIEVKFTGSVASALVSGAEANSLDSATVNGNAVTFTASGTGFEADTTLSGTYSENQAFTFTLVLTDAFGGASSLTVKVPKSKPVMSIRDGEVNVNGSLMQNSKPVMGYVANIGATDLNNLYNSADAGIYYATTSLTHSQHPPVDNILGVLEVFSDGNRAMQRFTQTDDTNSSGVAPASWIRIYRLYSGQMRWSNWYQITLSL